MRGSEPIFQYEGVQINGVNDISVMHAYNKRKIWRLDSNVFMCLCV